nr:enoyl-CoA hydratase-related protein [uncultured Gellertiella sp.]
MSAFQCIRLETDGRGIARLVLNRPDKHNALNETMMRELIEAVVAINADDGIRAVVLAAEGRSFCAGGDLAWMKDQAGRDRAGKIEGADLLASMLRQLDELEKPLIARVQGNAFGGGIGIMAVCDIVVVADSASFALTETRLGLIPATIGPYVIRRIGEGHARRTFLNASRFGSDAALAMGLASRISTPDRLDQAVEQEAEACLACAPGAIVAAKRLIRTLARQDCADPVAFSATMLADRWESQEAGEGIGAFLTQARAPWAG